MRRPLLCALVFCVPFLSTPRLFPVSTAYANPASSGVSQDKSFQTEALQAILYDLQTDTVLFAKEADQVMVPSSLTKVLLAYILFDWLNKGKVKPTDLFLVSEKAWRMGGSKMFVALGSQVPLSDLLQGIIVQSGNDACIVTAEGLAGSEDAFVTLMNTQAKALGAQNTHFLNSTGWPEKGHTSTARDILLFGICTIRDFPDLYAKYYQQIEFIYNGIRQTNRNPLLYSKSGDGLKTGRTDEGGFGLLGSSLRDDRRIIFVVNGLKSNKQRAAAAEQMVKYGFDHFEVVSLYAANAAVHQQAISGGSPSTVALITPKAIAVTVPRGQADTVKTKIERSSNVTLPLPQGYELGRLIVSVPGFPDKTFPLLTAEAVNELNPLKRWWTALKQTIASLVS